MRKFHGVESFVESAKGGVICRSLGKYILIKGRKYTEPGEYLILSTEDRENCILADVLPITASEKMTDEEILACYKEEEAESDIGDICIREITYRGGVCYSLRRYTSKGYVKIDGKIYGYDEGRIYCNNSHENNITHRFASYILETLATKEMDEIFKVDLLQMRPNFSRDVVRMTDHIAILCRQDGTGVICFKRKGSTTLSGIEVHKEFDIPSYFQDKTSWMDDLQDSYYDYPDKCPVIPMSQLYGTPLFGALSVDKELSKAINRKIVFIAEYAEGLYLLIDGSKVQIASDVFNMDRIEELVRQQNSCIKKGLA